MAERFRFAPSPTGELHLGNARTALLCWLQARSEEGTLVLRVEDLDRGRVRESFRASQLQDLRWLGLDWDEGPDVGGRYAPYLQSERSGLYAAAIEVLDRAGLVYPCVCSRKEIIAAASAPHIEDDDGPPYPGTCRDRERAVGSVPAALRFRVPAGKVSFYDELQGLCVFYPEREGGDFVVRRKDGVAAYQLAVVVDDSAMGITHVLRGRDLLRSTARQLALYEALRLEPPRWLHVPLMLGVGGDRLAKRQGALTLRALKERGFLAERVVGWLAWSCGLAESERETTPCELVDRWDPGRLARMDTPVAIPPWMIAT